MLRTIRRIKNYFIRITSSKTYFNREKLIVKLAFELNGVKYYEVDTVFNLPYERARAAVSIYEEVRMKCDYEFLKAYVTAVENIFKKKSIGFDEMAQLKQYNNFLKERLYQIVDYDLVYKLASVVYFDDTESALEYDWEYNRKKILRWKKEKSVNDFFLSAPVQKLIPSLQSPETGFQTYLEVVREIGKFQWENLFTNLSTEQKKTFSGIKDFYVNSQELKQQS